jgi:hypothetical protein
MPAYRKIFAVRQVIRAIAVMLSLRPKHLAMANARFFTSKLRMTKAALSSALSTQPKSLSRRRPGRGRERKRVTASLRLDGCSPALSQSAHEIEMLTALNQLKPSATQAL